MVQNSTEIQEKHKNRNINTRKQNMYVGTKRR